ncbi:hypothetical protein ACFFS2_20650 [Streptomyces aurantiacus]|uniref:ParB/Sulfiredoxin domain-containing protein n=1 Tax=Streptomyces aurantiacus TaxID=47760 RepID=A0A7G1PF56_9ACTN|nr:hypothetical protein [Streptomyces aurantiacus]BCL32387.1 hypothetical protein GCM10017557_72460 [Streptomyces aurantiacus]
MHMQVLDVSPQLAEKWLARNTSNRPLSKSTVQQLAGRIQRGEWQLTHQGIAFDEDDVLVDGQHRLAAIVKAGVVVPLTVTHGVPRAAFTVTDTGRKRTGRDALALAGEANATHLAAALRGLHLYLSAPDSAWGGGSSVTSNDQLLNLLGEHPGIRTALRRGIALNRGCRITVTAATIGWYVTSGARPDIDQSAWEAGVVTGARLEPSDPRLTLRNTMLNLALGNTHRRRDDSREHLLYYLKAWNAWVEGRTIKLLRRSPNETMPRVSRRSAPAPAPAPTDNADNNA